MVYIFAQVKLPSKFMVSETMPKCRHCKFYNKVNLDPKFNECKKFPRISSQKDVLFEFAEICRNDFILCGPSAYQFELKELIDFIE